MLVGVLLPLSARAELNIPVVGRPTPFYDAAGKDVVAEATAEPTDVTPDDSIAFTLTIRNLRNPDEVRKPDLEDLEPFRRAFRIEDDATPISEPAGTRIFRYRLRPRGADVHEIPKLTFPYYDPDRPQPPDRPDFPFRRAETKPIAIRVVKTAAPPLPIVPLEVPEFAASLATPGATEVPNFVWWLAVAIPPFAAAGFVLVWRLLNPEGSRLARRRRSRAARIALKALHAAGRYRPDDATPVVEILAGYLSERFDMSGVFRTPGDVTNRLREANASSELVDECAGFFHAADVARFAPSAGFGAESLRADAERLIRRLEGDA